jgi:hypothetical protein
MTTWVSKHTIAATGEAYYYSSDPADPQIRKLPGLNVSFQPDSIYHWLDGTQGGGIAPNPPAFDILAHTSTILKDGVVDGTYPNPMLLHRGGWRHKITPDNADLTNWDKAVAAGLTLPHGFNGLANQGKPATYAWNKSGDRAGLIAAESTTGERDEIGFRTEQQAYLMRTRDMTMASTIFAQSDGVESFNINITDPRTGKPWNMVQYPLNQTYGGAQGAGDFIGSDTPATPLPPGISRPTSDYGHTPSANFDAYVLSGNTRHLHRLQLHFSSLALGDNAWGRDWKKNKFVITQGQDRSAAWVLNRLLQCLVATRMEEAKGPLASFLLPSAVYDQLLDDQLAFWTEAFMNNPVFQKFRACPGFGAQAPPYHEYFMIVLAWAALVKPNFRPFYKWKFYNVIARASTRYGWKTPAMPTIYRLRYGLPFVPDQFYQGAGAWRNATASQYFADWAQVSDFCLNGDANNPPDAIAHGNMNQTMVDKLKADPMNGGKWLTWDSISPTGYHQALAAGVYLDRLKLPGLDLSVDYPSLEADYALQNSFYVNTGKAWNKTSLAVLPKPNGGISLPSSVTITVGQKVHLDVTFVGPQPPSAPSYTQSDATVGSLSNGDMTGVLFSSAKAGQSTVTATTNGVSGPLSAACVVTVNPPLPTGITLTPGTVT